MWRKPWSQPFSAAGDEEEATRTHARSTHRPNTDMEALSAQHTTLRLLMLQFHNPTPHKRQLVLIDCALPSHHPPADSCLSSFATDPDQKCSNAAATKPCLHAGTTKAQDGQEQQKPPVGLVSGSCLLGVQGTPRSSALLAPCKTPEHNTNNPEPTAHTTSCHHAHKPHT